MTDDEDTTADDDHEKDGTDGPTEQYRTDDYVHEADDGTDLAIRVFRPEWAGPDDPVPVALQRTPYGRPDEPEETFAPMAIDAGYAVAYEDTRGRGDSGGAFEPWVHEAADGRATIEWLADRPWSTGDVGTFGGSSPGQVQVLAATERPEGLRAMAPIFTPSDLHRADFFQDGAMAAMTFLTWSLDESVAGHTVDRLERAGRLDEGTAEACREALADALDRLDEIARQRPLVDLLERILADVDLPDGLAPADVVPHWEEWTSRPAYDEFWRSFDPEPDYGRIDTPGLHATGWYELCQSGTLANFAGLRDRSPAPQHLVVGPWSHQNAGSEIGDLAYGEAASMDGYGFFETQLSFFDAYVRGEGAFPDAGPDRLVETFRTTVADGDGGGTWTRHGDWPPTDAAAEQWFLHSDGAAATDPADGRLSRRPPGKFEPADEYVHDPTDPVPTRGGPLCCGEYALDAGPRDQRPVEERTDVCTYTTPPLAEPLVLAGPISLRLTVATTAPDTDFTGKLVHVTGASEGDSASTIDGLEDDPGGVTGAPGADPETAGSGAAYNLCEGIRRVRFRHGRDRPTPVPDDPFRVEIDTWACHHRIPAGDRLRLEVASSNHPRFDAHPGTTDPWTAGSDDIRSAEQTVFHERDRESVLELTVRRP